MASLLVGAPITLQSLNSSRRISFSRSETLAVALTTLSPSPSSPTTLSSIPFVYCGRGDKKTAKGKRFNHSFGNARPRDKKKGRGPPRPPVPPPPPTKKDLFEDNEVVKIEIDDESLFSG